MKLTKKQKEEIDFYSNFGKESFTPTESEIEEYIKETVLGKKSESLNIGKGNSQNRLSQAKRSFEITYNMWKDDLENYLITKDEVVEWVGEYPFGKKIINNLFNNLNYKTSTMVDLIRSRDVWDIKIKDAPELLSDRPSKILEVSKDNKRFAVVEFPDKATQQDLIHLIKKMINSLEDASR